MKGKILPFGPRGRLELVLRDKRGRYKARRVTDNLFLNNAKHEVVDFLDENVTALVAAHMGIGRIDTGLAVENTALGGEVGTRVAFGAGTGRTNNVVTMISTFGADNPDGGATLKEAGIFYLISGGALLQRATFAQIIKGDQDSLTITWTTTF